MAQDAKMGEDFLINRHENAFIHGLLDRFLKQVEAWPVSFCQGIDRQECGGFNEHQAAQILLQGDLQAGMASTPQ